MFVFTAANQIMLELHADKQEHIYKCSLFFHNPQSLFISICTAHGFRYIMYLYIIACFIASSSKLPPCAITCRYTNIKCGMWKFLVYVCGKAHSHKLVLNWTHTCSSIRMSKKFIHKCQPRRRTMFAHPNSLEANKIGILNSSHSNWPYYEYSVQLQMHNLVYCGDPRRNKWELLFVSFTRKKWLAAAFTLFYVAIWTLVDWTNLHCHWCSK